MNCQPLPASAVRPLRLNTGSTTRRPLPQQPGSSDSALALRPDAANFKCAIRLVHARARGQPGRVTCPRGGRAEVPEGERLIHLSVHCSGYRSACTVVQYSCTLQWHARGSRASHVRQRRLWAAQCSSPGAHGSGAGPCRPASLPPGRRRCSCSLTVHRPCLRTRLRLFI